MPAWRRPKPCLPRCSLPDARVAAYAEGSSMSLSRPDPDALGRLLTRINGPDPEQRKRASEEIVGLLWAWLVAWVEYQFPLLVNDAEDVAIESFARFFQHA